MTRIIPPLLIGAATGGTEAGVRLLEQQPVGMATAITIATFAVTTVLWLQRKFDQRDKAQAERDLKVAGELASQNLAVAIRLAAIEQALKDLPCAGVNVSVSSAVGHGSLPLS